MKLKIITFIILLAYLPVSALAHYKYRDRGYGGSYYRYYVPSYGYYGNPYYSYSYPNYYRYGYGAPYYYYNYGYPYYARGYHDNGAAIFGFMLGAAIGAAVISNQRHHHHRYYRHHHYRYHR